MCGSEGKNPQDFQMQISHLCEVKILGCLVTLEQGLGEHASSNLGTFFSIKKVLKSKYLKWGCISKLKI